MDLYILTTILMFLIYLYFFYLLRFTRLSSLGPSCFFQALLYFKATLDRHIVKSNFLHYIVGLYVSVQKTHKLTHAHISCVLNIF